MKLSYVPLIPTMRELHRLPRNSDRFQEYLRTLRNEDGTGLAFPSLSIMNPMGKQHVADMLDALLAMDADGMAARTVAEAAARLADDPGEFKVSLVVADDWGGGWTNRYDWEFEIRFPEGSSSPTSGKLPRWLEDFWITAVLWSSEPASARSVETAVLMAIDRTAYIRRHGPAVTLKEMLTQEGAVMARAGCTEPSFDDDEIAYTREVLLPLLDAKDKRTAIECLFGDAAARTLGFTPRGLSPWAGLALALHDARRDNLVIDRFAEA